ncbi:MAG: hypothetical protein J7556_22240 [Acidovorax sp.]|nr:hypothetical protein [Acidovorax sp.]
MSGFSTSLANGIINWVLRGQAAPVVRNRYFALFKADPTDAFTAGTEVDAAWYQRQPAGDFAAPANGVTYNATRVEFAPVVGAPVDVTHIGIVEGATPSDPTSTLLFSQPLPEAKRLTVNDKYQVDSDATTGDFTLTLV